MDAEHLIPVLVGVTGHRRLAPAALPALELAVERELTALRRRCPHAPVKLVSGMAVGADTLCARVALRLGIPLLCALPLPLEEYEKDFSPPELVELRQLLARAEQVFVTPATEPGPEGADRDFAYRQQGLHLTLRCHALLALWDGGAPQSGGCGTAEVADMALRGSWRHGPRDTLLGSGIRTPVIHIYAPRAGAADTERAGKVALLGSRPHALRELLAETDEYDRCAAQIKTDAPGWPLLSEAELQRAGPRARRFHALYLRADALAIHFQDLYLQALSALSWLGTGAVLALLLYDELESDWFLPVYALVLLAAAGLVLAARRGGWHKKYLEFRMLAELGRVQTYLLACGVADALPDALAWAGQADVDWLLKGADAQFLLPETPGTVPLSVVREAWVAGQAAYHGRALGKSRRQLRVNDRVTNVALLLSLSLFAAVAVLELLPDRLMELTLAANTPLITHPGAALTLRGLLKIVLGAVSAGTLFLSNYYGKLSLPRRTEEHRDMGELYARVSRLLDQPDAPQTELLWALAVEQLRENRRWMSYCRDNALGLMV